VTDDIAQSLLDCASRGDLSKYAEALAAIPVNRLNTIGKEPAFQASVERLVPIARTGISPLQRLTALALIGRADSTTQQKQSAIGDAVKASVATEPPPLAKEAQDALNPDDRYYVALTIVRGDPAWSVQYAARALVNEGGEPRIRNDVRGAFAALIFDGSPTLEAGLRQIAAAVPGSLHENPETKGAEISRARRISKLLPAIEEALRRTVGESGEGLSDAFNEMMQALVFRYSRPSAGAESDEVAGAVADAAFQLLGTLVRTRFSTAVEAETYKSVGRLQYWLKTRSWPDVSRNARDRLAQSLLEAISVRSTMGKASVELLKVLIQLLGHRPSAVRLIAPLADRPGIPSDVQEWLRNGGVKAEPRFQTEASEESGLRDVDALVATAMLRALHVQRLIEGDAKAALGKVRDHTDLEASALQLTQAYNYARALANDVAAVTKRRSMSVFGVVGEIVEADPRRHKSRDGALIETQRARIEVPGVERSLPNGTTEIIVAAIVTPEEIKRK
jgi:hypothetical protein